MEEKKLEWAKPVLRDLGVAGWITSGQPFCNTGYSFVYCGVGGNAEDVCNPGAVAVYGCTTGGSNTG